MIPITATTHLPQTLSIDLETYSEVDLKKCGVHKYVEHSSFRILLLSYQHNNGQVYITDLANGEEIPEWLVKDMYNPGYLKTAYNAAFEIACLNKHLRDFHFCMPLDVCQWQCTSVKAAMLGLPFGLGLVAHVMRLDIQKNVSGEGLIKYFCLPCKPSKTNGGRTRNLPHHAPDKWNDFKTYCMDDVRTEKSVYNKLSYFQIPPKEQQLWELDQRINTAGIMIDRTLVVNALTIDAESRERLVAEAVRLTQLSNPNSVKQLAKWLSEEMDEEVTSLTKETVPELIKNAPNDTVERVLTIRQELAKTSVKKYTTMLAYICADGRYRGSLQFYGASRTGRWAGRGVQVHNLPKNKLKDLDDARQFVRAGDIEAITLFYQSVPDTLSQLIRTAFMPRPGHKFLIADFSAIEARVIAWLAGERWRLDVFTKGDIDIYKMSVSKMFTIAYEAVTKEQRNSRGKVAELALGYQGGPGALVKMGALKAGLTEDELPELVRRWREASPKIVQLWYKIGNAALTCVRTKVPQTVRGIGFYVLKGILFIKLPSGRCLSYLHPQIVDGKYGDQLQYEGIDQETKRWGKQVTYGGKLVENITQAIARDCLAEALLRVDAARFEIPLHVHDEIVIEVPEDRDCINEINAIMSMPVPWAPDLPLKADSYESYYYKKD